MSIEKTGVPLLEGSANYTIWAIKMRSFLIKENLEKTLDWDAPEGAIQVKEAKKAHSFMILHCKPGPTLQIQHEKYAKPAWEKLESFYGSQGFTSEFLLCKEFLNAKPENYKSLEAYLNDVKRLSVELKA